MTTNRVLGLILGGLLILVCQWTSAQTNPSRSQSNTGSGAVRKDPVSIVTAACKDAGEIHTSISPAKGGRTFVLLEESHDAVAGQIELAAVLVRLHAAGMKQIVLEGYLKDARTGAPQNPVSRDWFQKAAGTLPVDVQREVAARMLKEGEISAAEFLFLAYDDIRLIPGETPDVRRGELNDNHGKAINEAVSGIAQAVLKDAVTNKTVDVGKFNQLGTRAQNAVGEQEKRDAAKKLMEYITSLDPWLKSAYAALTNEDLAASTALSDQARIHRELIDQAKKRGVMIDAKLLWEAAQFYENREKASDVMVESSVGTKPRIVVLNIGAAHSGRVSDLLKRQGLGVIVVRPRSFSDQRARLSFAQFDAKQQGRSVFDAGQIARLLKTLPDGVERARKKPEPSLTQTWCRAKGELYLIMSRLTRGILSPRAPPGRGEPPFGFANGDFTGDFFSVDPRRVRYIADENPKAILFPIVRNDTPGTVALWVKSALVDQDGMPEAVTAQSGVALSPAVDAERLVELLLGHRRALQGQSLLPRTADNSTVATEDRPVAEGTDASMIRVDVKTLAAVAFDENVAAAVKITR